MAKPSISELLDHASTDWVAMGRLTARVERVLALHGGSINLRNGEPYEYCPECSEDSPCPTVRALEGEE